jgi:hypothetical protein
MKKIISILIVFISLQAMAQKPLAEVNRYEKLTTTERNLLSPELTNIWLIFNETNNQFEWYNGASWVALDTVLTKTQIDALGLDLDGIADSSTRKALTTVAQSISGEKSFTDKITTPSLRVNGEITPSSAHLQVNGFQRTGNIYLHAGGNTPNNDRTSDYLQNVDGEVNWVKDDNFNKIYHSGDFLIEDYKKKISIISRNITGVDFNENSEITGTGSNANTDYLVNSRRTTKYDSTSPIAGIFGTSTINLIDGTKYSSIGDSFATLGSSRIDNPNTLVGTMRSGYFEMRLLNGTVNNASILALELTGSDYSVPNPNMVIGDFAYISSNFSDIPETTGNSYYIKSLVALPSLFSGKIIAPSFEGDFKTPTGIASQFLKADGSVDSNSYYYAGNFGKTEIDALGVDAETLDNLSKTDLAQLGQVNTWTKQQETTRTLFSGLATISIDLDTNPKPSIYLTQDATVNNPTNIREGVTFVVAITQDGTGSRLITWGSKFKWGDDGVPTLSTLADKTDILTFESDGVNMYLTNIKKGFYNYYTNWY